MNTPAAPQIECPDVTRIPGFRNQGETCYLDSILYLLLIVFDKFTQKYFYDDLVTFQQEGCKGKEIIRQMKEKQAALLQGKNVPCANLRRLINTCVTNKADRFKNKASDPITFLRTLLNIFNVTFNTRVTRTNTTTDETTTTFQEQNVLDIFMQNVSANDALSDFENYSITTGPNDNIVETTTYLPDASPELLPLQVYRLHENEQGRRVFVYTPMVVSQRFADKELHAIVCFDGGKGGEGGHVISFFKFRDPAAGCDYTWYKYDDTKGTRSVERIGTFDDLLNVERYNPTTNGILFWYWDANSSPTAWTGESSKPVQ